jgi:hypothetical protein
MKDRIMLGVAYVLLVAVVAFGAWWLEGQAAEAKKQRCEVANLEFGLAVLGVLSLPQEERDLQGEALDALLENAAEVTADICEGTGIVPSSLTPGEETPVNP